MQGGGVPVRHLSEEAAGLWKSWNTVITLWWLQKCSVWKLPLSFQLIVFAQIFTFFVLCVWRWVESWWLITVFCALLSWNVVNSSQRSVHVGSLSKNDESWRIYAAVCSLVRVVRVFGFPWCSAPLYSCIITPSFNPPNLSGSNLSSGETTLATPCLRTGGGHVLVGFPASGGRKTETLMNTETPEEEENMDDRWRNNSLETINCFSCGLKLAKTVILKTPNFKSGSNLITLSWAPTWVWPAGPRRGHAE